MDKYFIFLKIISVLLSEVAIAFYLILIFSFYGNLGNMNFVNNILINTIFMVLIPVTAIVVFYKQVVLDMGLIERNQRPKFYLANLISYGVVSFLLYYFNNEIMLKIALSYLLTMLVLFLINFKWKISLHGAGIAIGSMVLLLNFGLISLIFFALIPFVYWLRIKLKAHNIYQLLAGSFVGFLVTYIVFLTM